jgi:hypothetical protein
MSTRLIVMHRGRFTGEFTGPADRHTVMQAALGTGPAL